MAEEIVEELPTRPAPIITQEHIARTPNGKDIAVIWG
jgi:hypothetical protein